jgi:DNA-binding beta-propeller fold protein YncE
MRSDQRAVNILLISDRNFAGQILAAPLVLSLLICFLLCAAPAQATRLPAELLTVLKSVFPDCRIRLDGAVEAKDGELYLPILPRAASTAKAKIVRLKETLPAAAGAKVKTDIYVFDNGCVYVRVIKNLNIKTFPSFAGLSDKTHQAILSGGQMPVDLIVPESFALPASMRPIVGDVGMTLLKELPNTASPSTPGDDKIVKQPDKEEKGAGHGFIFVTSTSTGTITLVAEDTLKKIAEVPTEGTPGGMALVGDHLYIADQSKNRILILDVKGRSFLGQIDLPDKSHPKSVVALPNGKLLYVSESGLGLVAVVEVETSKVLLTTKVPTGPSRMAITPDGSTILVLNVPTGQLTFISTLNQKVLGTIAIGANPSVVVVAPDGAMAYVSCRSAGYVAIIDIAQKKMLGGLKAGNSPTGLAVDSEGKKLYVALARDNKIAVFDLATRALLKEIALPSDVDFPGTLCLLPDGKKLVVSSAATQSIGILNIEKGEFEDKPVIGHGTDETYFVPN